MYHAVLKCRNSEKALLIAPEQPLNGPSGEILLFTFIFFKLKLNDHQ